MKKSIVILFFLITLAVKAQGNLQFNQVINYQGTASNGNVSCEPTNSNICNSGPIWKVLRGKYGK